MIDTANQRINTLEKKVGLDAKSPLFAQLAYYYLETSRAEEALRICDAGLANFPFYTTGHLIKGKALFALNMRAEARREFEFVYDFLPNSNAVKKLLEQVPPIEAEVLSSVPLETQVASVQPEVETIEPEPPTKEYIYSAPEPQQPVRTEPDYSFGISEQPVSAPQVEPIIPSAPSAGTSFFDTITQTPTITPPEQSFNFGFETPTIEAPSSPETSQFGDFNFPQPEPTTFEETPSSSTQSIGGLEFNLPTPDLGFSKSTGPIEEESFDRYATRRRYELTGENSNTLEAYLNNTDTKNVVNTPTQEEPIILPPPAPFSMGVQDKIEELANTLQNVGKITPAVPSTPVINFAQKETSTASEQDTPAGMGFVTPTLAEIYAKQGWFDDAIKAYKTLARNKPADKERFEKRIAELEELKNKNG